MSLDREDKIMTQFCTCREHKYGAASEINGHGYGMETMGLHGDDEDGEVVFRWNCSCGIAGRWVHRRGDAYHLWLKHVDRMVKREHSRRGPVE